MADGPTGLAGLTQEVEEQIAQLHRELSEIELLVQQAKAEAGRHELRRNQARERMAALDGQKNASLADFREAATTLATTTGRAALMESQVDILGGKQRALARFRSSLERIADGLQGGVGRWPSADPASASPIVAEDAAVTSLPPALSRAILIAQEDQRRDIARAMHDGPAQSLTTIVLQAEIAHRLMERDPKQAADEVAQLVRMVQHALEATKTFIFDVRPMVLDDLGLVPTLRRAALDRGTRAGIPVAFESMGQDRRLVADIESGLFRILDDAVVGYLSTKPTSVSVALDWSETELKSVVRTIWPDPAKPAKTVGDTTSRGDTTSGGSRGRLGRRRGQGSTAAETPAALMQMIEEQREDIAAANQAAAEAVTDARSLPDASWREIAHRAQTLGLQVTLTDEGRSVVSVIDVPPTRVTPAT